jgi:hypothetical protein
VELVPNGLALVRGFGLIGLVVPEATREGGDEPGCSPSPQGKPQVGSRSQRKGLGATTVQIS